MKLDAEVASETELYGITLELREKLQIANRRIFQKIWLKSSQKVEYSLQEIYNVEEESLVISRECLRQPTWAKKKNRRLTTEAARSRFDPGNRLP
jgi:hypothetical protein